MTNRPEPRVAHVVRDFGGLTEPFIAQRVRAGGPGAELWYERAPSVALPRAARRIGTGLLFPGTLGDRLFHRLPAIGPPFAGGYAAAERESKPDVIHAHYLTAGYLVGSRTTTPLVVSTYGFDVGVIPRRRAWRGAIEALSRRGGAFLAEGPFMASTIALLGVDPAQIHVVPIAAALQDVPFRSPRPLGDQLTLIACGRLIEKKGHDLAIRALDRLRRSGDVGFSAKRIRLLIVGDGRQRPTLEALVAELQLVDQVAFLGNVDRATYLRTMSEADILVAPSRTAANGDTEGGAPTTILDAQAAGVIVVGSRHADIPFLVDDRQTGYLVPEGDAAMLADGIARAVGDWAASPDIARRGRDQVLQRHSDATIASALSMIHRSVAG